MLDAVGRGHGVVTAGFALNRVTMQDCGVSNWDRAHSECVKLVFWCPYSLCSKWKLTAAYNPKGSQDYKLHRSTMKVVSQADSLFFACRLCYHHVTFSKEAVSPGWYAMPSSPGVWHLRGSPSDTLTGRIVLSYLVQ